LATRAGVFSLRSVLAGKGALTSSFYSPKGSLDVLHLGVEKTHQSPVFSRVFGFPSEPAESTC
jgi:hypothetical protein